MATLHGKKLTAKQYAALQRKWERSDRMYWKKKYSAEVKQKATYLKRCKERMAAAKKKGSTLGIYARIVQRAEAELKESRLKLKKYS